MAEISVRPFHHRLAALRAKQKSFVGLTPEEEKELDQCLDLNVTYLWSQAILFNYSLMASITNDIDWQHDLCGEMDKSNWEWK